MAKEYMYWDDLNGLPINVANQGRVLGAVEDFFYQTETHAVNALRVDAGLRGHCLLLSSAISAIESTGITVANDNMLISEANAGPVYNFPHGSELIGFLVVTESGRQLGKIRTLSLGVYPPVTLRIAAFELDAPSRSPLLASEIISFGEGVLVISDQEGKKVH